MNLADKDLYYDVAVVGGGHNGLAAACYLAGKGKRVVVLEACLKVGGMSAAEYAIPEAPEHLIHTGATEFASLRTNNVVEELQLKRHGFEMIEAEASYAYLHTDGSSLVFWRDIKKTVEEIKKYSEKDAGAYVEFITMLGKMMSVIGPLMRADPSRPGIKTIFQVLNAARKNRKVGGELLALATGSAFQIVDERFEHPAVRSAIAGFAGGAGPIARDSSGLGFMLLAILHIFGFARPKGGMQTLPDAMVSRLKELGGDVFVEAKVEEIVAEKNKVKGVRLQDGRFINAKAVVASCHPKVALPMVTDGEIPQKFLKRVKHVPTCEHGSSPFRIDLALSGKVNYKDHQAERKDGLDLRIPVTMVGSMETVLENFDAASRGELPVDPYIWFVIPTALDPSQAPEGQDVLYLYPTAFPANPRGGWFNVKEKAVNIVLGWTRDVIADIDSLEIGRRVETSEELAHRLNVPGGSFVHIDVSLLRSASMRPAAGLSGELPVKGLFFGGAGAAPGGGVSGLPGRIASQRVLRFLK